MTLILNTTARAATVVAAALLVLCLAGCPHSYYDDDDSGPIGGDDDDDDNCDGMFLRVRLDNSTGYTWDGAGVAVDWADVAIYDTSPVADGANTLSEACWDAWSAGTQLPVYARVRDTDGDCYSPPSQTITVDSILAIQFIIQMDHYEGGGCP